MEVADAGAFLYLVLFLVLVLALAKLVITKPQQSCLCLPARIRVELCTAMLGFSYGCWGSELRFYYFQSKFSYPPSYLPGHREHKP